MAKCINLEDVMNYRNLLLDDIPTPIDVDRFQQLLRLSKYDIEKSNQLLQGFKYGFDLGYCGPLLRKNSAANLPLKVGSQLDLWNKLMTEVKLGRTAGPFQQPPYDYFVQSPIGLVPKQNGKTRLIFHLSFDFGDGELDRSVNHYTPKCFSMVHYRDLDYAIHSCLLWREEAFRNLEQQHPKSGIFMSKTDLQSAFKILPICVSQRFLLLMMARHPITQ